MHAHAAADAPVLHDEENLTRCVDDLEQLDDVLVTHALQDADLAAHALHVRRLHDAALLQDLDGHLLARHDVCANAHLAKGALTQRLAEQVVPDALGLARIGAAAVPMRTAVAVALAVRRVPTMPSASHGDRL